MYITILITISHKNHQHTCLLYSLYTYECHEHIQDISTGFERCDKNQIILTHLPPTYLSSKHVIYITMSRTYPGCFPHSPKISTTDHSLIFGNTINIWKNRCYVHNNIDHIFTQEPPTYRSSKLVIYITMSRTYPGSVSYTHLTLPTTSRV